MRPSITPEQRVYMIQRYAAGFSIYEIADELGCAFQTVYKHLVAAGVPLRSKSESMKLALEHSGRAAQARVRETERQVHQEQVAARKLALEQERKLACALYQQGRSASSIGKQLGRPTITISNWLKAAKIERRSQSEATRVHSLNERIFETIDTEEKAYWLGFLTADAGISDRNILRVNLQMRDKPHLERLRTFLGTSIAVAESHVRKETYSRDCCYLAVASPLLCTDLARYGVVPRKSIISKPYLGLNVELTRHYVRGLFDGDGSWSGLTKPGTVQWRLIGTRDLLLWVQALMMEQVQVRKTQLTDHHATPELAYLTYSGSNQVLRIAFWLYSQSTVYLPRKAETLLSYFEEHDKHRWHHFYSVLYPIPNFPSSSS